MINHGTIRPGTDTFKYDHFNGKFYREEYNVALGCVLLSGFKTMVAHTLIYGNPT
jgi:hypothetical protein